MKEAIVLDGTSEEKAPVLEHDDIVVVAGKAYRITQLNVYEGNISNSVSIEGAPYNNLTVKQIED